jgi:acid ceramidase
MLLSFVLFIDYDYWKPGFKPPFFDDRRTAMLDCMRQLPAQGLNFTSAYSVLHALPTRNRLTTYSALMDVNTGTLQSFMQYCEEPACPFW